MKKGSIFKNEVINRIVSLSLITPYWSGNEIREKLEQEFVELDDSDIPALRTIQDYMSRARSKEIGNIQEQPWSIAMLKEAIDIPWEATWFLLRAIDVLRQRQSDGENDWAWSSHPFDRVYKGTLEEVMDALMSKKRPQPAFEQPPADIAPPGTVLTNRQAKWLWRISITLPEWGERKWIPALCYIADDYAYREQLSEYLQDDFDTSDLDNRLMLVRRNIERKKEQKKAKED